MQETKYDNFVLKFWQRQLQFLSHLGYAYGMVNARNAINMQIENFKSISLHFLKYKLNSRANNACLRGFQDRKRLKTVFLLQQILCSAMQMLVSQFADEGRRVPAEITECLISLT